jgi:diguanylate cyclase (GGDEF)-like protein
MVNDFNNNLTHKLTLRTTLLSAIAVISSTVIRPIFIELPLIFSLIGLFNSGLILAVYFFVRSNKYPNWEVFALLSAALISLFPVLAISGGVNSQFAYVLPLLPIMGALLGGKREAVVMGSILFTAVALATYFGQAFADLTDEIYFEKKSFSRGFWLGVTLIISTYFGNFFQSKNREITQRLESQASHDALTGILNRRGFNTDLKREIELAKRHDVALSILMVDIDFFKKVNDEHGHDIGDVCLIGVAECLQNNIRASDVVARFGGEEFILLLPNTSLHAAVDLANKLRKIIANKRYSEEQINLTVTLGAASLADNDKSALDMIKRADNALYQGKKNGRNRVETYV